MKEIELKKSIKALSELKEKSEKAYRQKSRLDHMKKHFDVEEATGIFIRFCIYNDKGYYPNVEIDIECAPILVKNIYGLIDLYVMDEIKKYEAKLTDLNK